MRSTTQMIQD